jgi:hypothetical protein
MYRSLQTNKSQPAHQSYAVPRLRELGTLNEKTLTSPSGFCEDGQDQMRKKLESECEA